MTDRRNFLRLSALGTGAVLTAQACSEHALVESNPTLQPETAPAMKETPIVVSTWKHGITANLAAWNLLQSGGYALDAVEAGVRVAESDVENRSVGLGGYPDKEGKVTLDACIMNEKSNCGAVAFLQDIENPVSVARKVLDETPHVMLVGKGALDFALAKGFEKRNLLVPEAEEAWKKWMEGSNYTPPPINTENHDTIGMLAIDSSGRISGACTTSGAAYKMHGRVGDSPIIGAGLFLDSDVGAACATGLGEAVIRVSGSAMVVELMRQGHAPEEACKIVVERIINKLGDMTHIQVGFLALNKHGEYGGYSVYNGFNFALKTGTREALIDCPFNRKW